jgi:hypothetical protein
MGSRGIRVSFIVIIVSAVVASIGVGVLGATIFLRAQSESDLRKALVANCESSPLKEAEIEDQREAIVKRDDPRLHLLLPDTPQSVIDSIVAEGNSTHRARIKGIEDVDCNARYR